MSFHHHNFPQFGTTDPSSFLGAFAGAFFAFVFGLLAYWITKRRERFIQHKNSLVKLERTLNRNLADLASLKKIAADTKRIFDNKKVTSNRLFTPEIPDGIDMELGSIMLINELLTYQIYLKRLDFNVRSLNHSFNRFEEVLINGQPLPVENLSAAINHLDDFANDLPNLEKVTEHFLVKIRVHLRRIKNKNSFVYGVLNSQWDFDILNIEIQNESEKLEKEIQVVSQESKNKVERNRE